MSSNNGKVHEVLTAGTDKSICQLDWQINSGPECEIERSTHWIDHPYLYDPNGKGGRRIRNEALGDFWPIVKRILAKRNEGYSQIFWSNLYKIAPLNGNPDDRLKKAQQGYCNELLLHELQRNEPLAAIFITETNPPRANDWFQPFKQHLKEKNVWKDVYPRLSDLIIPEVGLVRLNGFDCRIVLAVRPGRRMKTEERDGFAERIIKELPPDPPSRTSFLET